MGWTASTEDEVRKKQYHPSYSSYPEATVLTKGGWGSVHSHHHHPITSAYKHLNLHRAGVSGQISKRLGGLKIDLSSSANASDRKLGSELVQIAWHPQVGVRGPPNRIGFMVGLILATVFERSTAGVGHIFTGLVEKGLVA